MYIVVTDDQTLGEESLGSSWIQFSCFQNIERLSTWILPYAWYKHKKYIYLRVEEESVYVVLVGWSFTTSKSRDVFKYSNLRKTQVRACQLGTVLMRFSKSHPIVVFMARWKASSSKIFLTVFQLIFPLFSSLLRNFDAEFLSRSLSYEIMLLKSDKAR